jgi:hypothetical protein
MDYSMVRRVMISRLPEIIAGLPIDAISKFSVKIKVMKWIGPTTCTEGDPRLFVHTGGYSFTTESGVSESVLSIMPQEADPCK